MSNNKILENIKIKFIMILMLIKQMRLLIIILYEKTNEKLKLILFYEHYFLSSFERNKKRIIISINII